jgi:hypothetical protein
MDVCSTIFPAVEYADKPLTDVPTPCVSDLTALEHIPFNLRLTPCGSNLAILERSGKQNISHPRVHRWTYR